MMESELIKACSVGDKKKVERLLDQGANMDCVSFYGHSPLYVASQEGYE